MLDMKLTRRKCSENVYLCVFLCFCCCYFWYYSLHPPRIAQANLRVEPQICIAYCMVLNKNCSKFVLNLCCLFESIEIRQGKSKASIAAFVISKLFFFSPLLAGKQLTKFLFNFCREMTRNAMAS